MIILSFDDVYSKHTRLIHLARDDGHWIESRNLRIISLLSLSFPHPIDPIECRVIYLIIFFLLIFFFFFFISFYDQFLL